MNVQPTRRFFRIHLSTAFILMIIAAVLVWANVAVWPGIKPYWDIYGFPFICAEESVWIAGTTTWHYKYCVYNALTGFAILAAVWYLCERRIQRKSAIKGVPDQP